MSALTDYLKNHQGGWGQTRKLREVATATGIDIQALREEAMGSLEVLYTPTIDGGTVTFQPLPPRKLTREDRKISKSKQP